MHDTLDVLVEPSLKIERAPEIIAPDRLTPDDGEPWWMKFYDPHLDKYDWEDPEWKARNARDPRGFYPIYLTQGFFMIVSKRDYKRMTTYQDGSPKKWSANIQRDEFGEIQKVYAYRAGKHDEPNKVYAHREVTHCIYEGGAVDHINGYGLDNRGHKSGVNLILSTVRVNLRNNNLTRRANPGLLRGVEKRGFNKDGKQRFGGIRSRRIKPKGRGSVRTIRTKRTWLSQEPANRWYLKQIERLSGGRKNWAHAPSTVHFPVFPPLMTSEPSRRSIKLRNGTRAHELADVPF